VLGQGSGKRPDHNVLRTEEKSGSFWHIGMQKREEAIMRKPCGPLGEGDPLKWKPRKNIRGCVLKGAPQAWMALKKVGNWATYKRDTKEGRGTNMDS